MAAVIGNKINRKDGIFMGTFAEMEILDTLTFLVRLNTPTHLAFTLVLILQDANNLKKFGQSKKP